MLGVVAFESGMNRYHFLLLLVQMVKLIQSYYAHVYWVGGFAMIKVAM